MDFLEQIQNNCHDELKARNRNNKLKKFLLDFLAFALAFSLIFFGSIAFLIKFIEEEDRQLCEGMKYYGGKYSDREIVVCKKFNIEI